MNKVTFSEVEIGENFFDKIGGDEYIKIRVANLGAPDIVGNENPKVNALLYRKHVGGKNRKIWEGTLHFVPSEEEIVFIKE